MRGNKEIWTDTALMEGQTILSSAQERRTACWSYRGGDLNVDYDGRAREPVDMMQGPIFAS